VPRSFAAQLLVGAGCALEAVKINHSRENYLCYSMGKKNQNRAEPHVWKPYKYARGKLPLLGISPIGIDIATLPPPLLFKTTEMQEQ